MKEKTMNQRISDMKGRSPMDKATSDSERYPEWMLECNCRGCAELKRERKIGGVRKNTAKE